MINWKIRFKNPMFIAQLVMSVLLPVLGYAGLKVSDLTSWQTVGDLLMQAISNPYVLGLVVVSVYNAIIDPTTKGVKDSERVLDKNKV